MRILFIVPYVPSRIRVRSFEFIRNLARRGHEVTVATLWSSREEQDQLAELEPYTTQVISRPLRRRRSLANCARASVCGAPLQALYCWQPDLARDLQGSFRAQRFDVVHTEHLRGACYGLRLKAQANATRQTPAFIWDSVDCISDLLRKTATRSVSLKWRLLARMEFSRTRRQEASFAAAFGNVIFTAAEDARQLKALTAETHKPPFGREPTLHVVPMGVDTEYFKLERKPQEPPTLVFVGKMSYHANASAAVHLVKDLMPGVWRARPDVRLYLVGKDPPKAVTRLTRGRKAQAVVTGTVADVREYLHRSSIAVAPLTYATGMQSKVLEAMATGLPVIASSAAVSSLTAVAGREVWVADGADDFTRQALELIENPELGRRIGLAGRAYVERNHSWQKSTQALEAVYGAAQEHAKA